MELELVQLGRMLRRRWLLIALATALLVGGAGAWSWWLADPRYEAEATLLVQSGTQSNAVSAGELMANQKLLTTYGEIIKSRQIADDVIRRLNLGIDAELLLAKVKVQTGGESLVTTLTVQDADPRQAVRIANEFAFSFTRNLDYILNVDNVTILDEANLQASLQPVFPRPFLNLGIAFVLGILLGTSLALLLEGLDRTVRREEEVEEELNLPLLGVIPSHAKKAPKGGT